jgi:HK97 family phage major capsid protein
MNEYQKRMKKAFDQMEAIRKKAEAEKRAMTTEEIQERASLKTQIDTIEAEMKSVEAEEELRGRLFGASDDGAVTIAGEGNISVPDAPIYRGSNATALGMQLMDIRTMSRPDVFSNGEVKEARSRLEQTQKRNEKRQAEQLKKEGRAASTGGMTVGVAAEGGLFLQGETATELMTNGFNNSEILPKTAKRTLGAGSQWVEINGIDESSRVTGSRGGGIRIYTNKELGEFTSSKTKFKTIRIEPSKLTGLFKASGEMMRNVTFLGQEMRQLFGEEFAFKGQDLVYRGSGAGEALGILNSNCLVSVAKESGQKAATILTENLSKMWARFRGRNPVWFINQDVNPQLDQLSIVAGTAALEPRFVTYDAQGMLRIKGAPVVAIEQAETLGAVGDIILADWSQYICADKGDILEAMSIHVDFIYDQEMYRFIYYFDGQPRWTSAITPYKGTNTVSPFVALAVRA